MTSKKPLLTTILFLIVTVLATSAVADEPVRVGGKTLTLIGKGVREFLFVDIYKMGAYSESGDCGAKKIVNNDETKSIRLSMVREIPAARMRSTLKKSLYDGMEDENDEAMKKTIDEFLAVFKDDMPTGTFVEINYIPGTGTIVKRNGKKLGVTPGLEFHKLLWASYFGKDSCCESLKEDIIEACKAQ